MLTNIETIIKNEIDYNNYLTSLIELSLKYKLITKDIYNEINLKLYHLLKIILKKYTGELNYTISISEAKLIKTYSFFHFFFLPLFKWNEKYYVICNGCNSIFNIDKEKGKAIERGEKSEISYWDLKEVNNSYENYYIRKCPKCNRELENDFEYCPYCGEKLK